MQMVRMMHLVRCTKFMHTIHHQYRCWPYCASTKEEMYPHQLSFRSAARSA